MPDDGGMTPGARFERMEAVLLRIEQKLDAKVDKAVLEALESEREKRHAQQLHYYNTRLQTVSELAGRVVVREEYNDKHEALVERMSSLERWQANFVGRVVGLTAVGAVLVAVVSGFATHLLG